MPGFVPPSFPASAESLAAPWDGVWLDSWELRLRSDIRTALLIRRIVVDLQAGFAETVDLCSLPKDDGHNCTDDEPSAVQPGGSSDNKEDHGKSDDFYEVRRHEEADSAGRIIAANKMTDQKADRKEEHDQRGPECC